MRNSKLEQIKQVVKEDFNANKLEQNQQKITQLEAKAKQIRDDAGMELSSDSVDELSRMNAEIKNLKDDIKINFDELKNLDGSATNVVKFPKNFINNPELRQQMRKAFDTLSQPEKEQLNNIVGKLKRGETLSGPEAEEFKQIKAKLNLSEAQQQEIRSQAEKVLNLDGGNGVVLDNGSGV